MSVPTILAVDPGGTATGIVARRGGELLWHATVTGSHLAVIEALAGLPPIAGWFDALAIEEVVAPGGFANGKRQPISLPGLIGCAVTAGAVAGWGYTDPTGPVIWVPPAHNGQGPIDAYPEPLRPSRGQGKGHDSLRHCRSAWDVASTAALKLRGRPVGARQAG